MMTGAAAVCLTSALCSTPPAPADSNPAPAPAASSDREVGEMTLRFVDLHAREARRERFTEGSFSLLLAGSQIGLGAYGITLDEDGSTGIRRAAIGQTITGSVGLVGAILGLARRSRLERLRRGPSYADLAANPGDADAREQLYRQWGSAAKLAKRQRLTKAGVQVGLGAVLVVLSSVRLSQLSEEATTGEQLWAFTTLTTAIGVTLSGVPYFIVRSATERSFAGYETTRARTRAQVRVAPTIGGMSVAGRF